MEPDRWYVSRLASLCFKTHICLQICPRKRLWWNGRAEACLVLRISGRTYGLWGFQPLGSLYIFRPTQPLALFLWGSAVVCSCVQLPFFTLNRLSWLRKCAYEFGEDICTSVRAVVEVTSFIVFIVFCLTEEQTATVHLTTFLTYTVILVFILRGWNGFKKNITQTRYSNHTGWQISGRTRVTFKRACYLQWFRCIRVNLVLCLPSWEPTRPMASLMLLVGACFLSLSYSFLACFSSAICFLSSLQNVLVPCIISNSIRHGNDLIKRTRARYL